MTTVTHQVLCNVPDPINHKYVCSKNEGHVALGDIPHEDARYPGRRWYGSRA